MAENLTHYVEEIKLCSSERKEGVKRAEFSMKFVFRRQREMPNEKSKARKFVKVSTPNNLFSQQNCKSETIFGTDINETF